MHKVLTAELQAYIRGMEKTEEERVYLSYLAHLIQKARKYHRILKGG